MNERAAAVVEDCRLTDSQRTAILTGIAEGKRLFTQTMEAMPKTSTTTYSIRFLYELVNTCVENEILKNSHVNMNVEHRKAGFYPYIVARDQERNVAALVLPIPSGKDFEPCLFRGEFAMTNVDRLLAMGATIQDLAMDIEYQPSLPFGIDHLPFGLIVSYDREKEIVFEGALQPNQELWLFNEAMTGQAVVQASKVVSFPKPMHDDTDISLSLTPAALQEKERAIRSNK
jgi:hypothetical protein